MSLLFAPLLLAILCVALVRRAAAILAAGAAGWTLWWATHDLLTTCVGGSLSLIFAAAIFDGLASAKQPGLRRVGVLLETSLAAASAGCITVLTAPSALSDPMLVVSVIMVALVAAGIVLDWRNRTVRNRHA
jgi:hypothetical protein